MRLGRWRLDGFLVAIAAALAAAALAPGLGATGGPVGVDRLAGAAVALVFFLHGATLPLESLAAGARNLRLHLLVQAMTYAVFPALGALVLVAGGDRLPPGLALGFFFLCACSSTISSSVALTAIAGGNVAGALFNATLSGVLGVVLTPLYVGLVAHQAGVEVPLATAIGAIAYKVLLPLVAGQTARPLLARFLARHRGAAGLADRGAVVLIVYGAFCDSIRAGIWQWRSAPALVVVALLAALLFAAVTGGLRAACRGLGFTPADEVAALFCGSQKSLANGLPIAKVLFGGSPLLGFIVLPLLLYHQLQLTAGAVIARRYAAASSRVPP